MPTKRQCSLTVSIALMLVFAAAAVVIARMPVEGAVTVNQENSWRVEAILARSGVNNWTGHSSMGGSQLRFASGFALRSVEDQIVRDATANAYYVKIQYEALVPMCGSELVVNENAGMFP